MTQETTNQFMKQIMSGRWILTVLSGVCLVILTAAYVKNPETGISGEAIVGILTGVFTSYFHKDRTNGNGKKRNTS